MAGQQFVYKTTLLIRLGKRIIMGEGVPWDSGRGWIHPRSRVTRDAVDKGWSEEILEGSTHLCGCTGHP